MNNESSTSGRGTILSPDGEEMCTVDYCIEIERSESTSTGQTFDGPFRTSMTRKRGGVQVKPVSGRLPPFFDDGPFTLMLEDGGHLEMLLKASEGEDWAYFIIQGKPSFE